MPRVLRTRRFSGEGAAAPWHHFSPRRTLSGHARWSSTRPWQRWCSLPTGPTVGRLGSSNAPSISSRRTWEPARASRFRPHRTMSDSGHGGRDLNASVPPGAWREIAEIFTDLDIRAVLPHILAPTLVLHRSDDRVVDVAQGKA